MNIQTIVKDGKPEYVVLPWEEYQALLAAAEDSRDAAQLDDFAKKLAAGKEETVPESVLEALLAGESPLKVWREYRGLTQEALASQAGISKAYVSQIESGKRQGAIKTLQAIARVLALSLDDLQ